MKIQWTALARHHLEVAIDYIARDNPRAAAGVFEKLVGHVEHLAHHPQMGRPGRVSGTRELVVQSLPYVVAYRVRGEVVQILAVLHTSRKWPPAFTD